MQGPPCGERSVFSIHNSVIFNFIARFCGASYFVSTFIYSSYSISSSVSVSLFSSSELHPCVSIWLIFGTWYLFSDSIVSYLSSSLSKKYYLLLLFTYVYQIHLIKKYSSDGKLLSLSVLSSLSSISLFFNFSYVSLSFYTTTYLISLIITLVNIFTVYVETLISHFHYFCIIHS